MRILHTMLRVDVCNAPLIFIPMCWACGCCARRQSAIPVHAGVSGIWQHPGHAEIKLTYNYGDQYEMGTAYGHLAITVPDAAPWRASAKQAASFCAKPGL